MHRIVIICAVNACNFSSSFYFANIKNENVCLQLVELQSDEDVIIFGSC